MNLGWSPQTGEICQDIHDLHSTAPEYEVNEDVLSQVSYKQGMYYQGKLWEVKRTLLSTHKCLRTMQKRKK